ncbi:MAG: Protein of unknown function DUF2085, transmembrane [Bacteroidetes bacterium]|nr:Protein of unknown function DUF2085, transmembrane [Bacteroidota bacterium]
MHLSRSLLHDFVTPLRTYLTLLFLVALWCAALLAAPLLQSCGSPAGGFFYEAFSKICHQMDERSFHLAGFKLAVCARCSAIYFGFLLALLGLSLLGPLEKLRIPRLLWLGYAALPMCLDVILNDSGILFSTLTTRAFTGLIFGAALPFYIAPTLLEAVAQIRRSSLNFGGFHADKTE